jgi:hypothetical protein
MTDVLHEPGLTTTDLGAEPACSETPSAPESPKAGFMTGRYGAVTLAAASLTLLAAVAADVVNVTLSIGTDSVQLWEQRGYETADGQVLAGLAVLSLIVALFGCHRRRTRWLLLSIPTTLFAVAVGAFDVPDELDRITRANHENDVAGIAVHGAAGFGNRLVVLGAVGMLAATILAVIRR